MNGPETGGGIDGGDSSRSGHAGRGPGVQWRTDAPVRTPETTMTTTILTALLVLLAFLSPARAAGTPELGAVRWGTDPDAALAASRADGRPVLLLFQEIPGCATCVGFGAGPLSNPLYVEAIEDLFHPVAVRNNAGGREQAIRERFGEPAWNNPVVRFLDARGKDVLPRKDGVWDAHGTGERMVAALEAAGRPVPRWLELAVLETDEARLTAVTFGMDCFWEGEARLGAIDGVTATEAGFLGGSEVVTVTCDTRVTPVEELARRAREAGVAGRAWAALDRDVTALRSVLGNDASRNGAAARPAPPSDRKYYLAHSPFNGLPLTPIQRARVNADLAAGRDGTGWLSPRQLALLESAAGD